MDNNIEYVKVEDIIPSKFPPHQDDDLDGLTISIQNYGIITPLLLRNNDEKYEIVLGNRRFEAAKSVGLKQVPAIIKKMNDKEATEYIMLDNIQRKSLTPNEKKMLCKNLTEKYKVDKFFISSNLGIENDDIEEVTEDSQSNLLINQEEKESFEEEVKPTKINLEGHDIVNLDDLNQRELEREDDIMNNEMNTNLNTINPPQENTNNTPTFGGRFFPSLEDEQTNMNLNTGVSNMNGVDNSSNLIDLTNLGNDNMQQPNLDPVNQSAPDLTPVEIPTPETPTEPSPTIDINQTVAPEPAAETIAPSPTIDINIPAPEQPVAAPTPQIDIPQVESTSANPIETPTAPITDINVNIPSPTDMPNLQDIVPQSTPVESNPIAPEIDINIPAPEQPVAAPTPVPVVPTPQIDIPQVESTPINPVEPPVAPTTPVTTAPIPDINTESKDITPAINTIKSLVESISSIGYKLTINENDLGTKYNISIDIER